MSETQPTHYVPESPYAMTLKYSGIASDIMELNDPIADGYMDTTDARADIVIECAQPTRVFSYEGTSSVQAAKITRFAQFATQRSRGNYSTEFAQGSHIIKIDDQAIAREIHDEGFEKGTFDERFVSAFQTTVQAALKTCLQREKLLNNGKYNVDFLMSQFGFLGLDVFMIPHVVGIIAAAGYPGDAAKAGALLVSVHHVVAHSLKMREIAMRKRYEKLYPGRRNAHRIPVLQSADANDPFVRRYSKKPWEMLFPPVPVDKLVRGIVYLHRHGGELVRSESAKNG